MTHTPDKLLNQLLDALLAEQYDSTQAVKLSSDYLDLPEQALADERLGLISSNISGPRWWRDYATSEDVAEYLGDRLDEIHEEVASITDAQNHARDEAAFNKLLLRLKKLVGESRKDVEADFDTCLPLLPQFESAAAYNDPVLHMRRFAVDLLQDLHHAEELCETAEKASVPAGLQACKTLARLSESILKGTMLVSSLADDLHERVNTLTKNSSEE